MAGGRHDPVPAAREQLADGRRRVRESPAEPRTAALSALQRSAGNAAVSALIAGRWRSRGGEAVEKIDTALREVRGDAPDVAKVEPGLRAAKAAGVPVDLDGYAQKPPASALDVVRTGFGPGAVPGRRPTPPPKPTPPKSPLAKASGPARKPAGPPGKGAAGPPVTAGPAPVAAPAPDLLAPPVPPTRVGPTDDPGFVHVTKTVRGQARAKKAHAPAAVKAKEAQDAALAPSGDVDAQAKAAKVDTMDAQRPGGFDKKAFIAAVKSAIEAKTPKNLNEAADYQKSGKAGEVKGEVKSLVSGDKQAAAQDVETATVAPPDPATAVPKQVTPMPAEQPGQPQAVPAATAVPKPAPPEQLNLAAGKHEADREMAEGEVTEQQLSESNEPEFEGAVAAKHEAARHADTAPAAFRVEEKATLAQERTDANQQTAATTAGMHGGRLAALAKVVAGKAATKSKDEARRAEVTTKVQGIFAATETAVKKILTGIDPKVDKEFESGEKGARAAFEQYVHAKMTAYKKDRYGGWLGGFRWLRDKLAGMPPKVNEFFAAGRELYLKEMDKVISRVAEIVVKDLTAAKNRIAAGKTEIATYVKGLPGDLKKVGTQAAKEIGDQFQQLESDVDAKQNALVNSLASKYVEARKGLDDRIEALQAENKGLIDKAIGAIKAVINTIRQLAAMLRDVFVKAAGVVGQIIKSPSRFLGNMVSAVKGGIQRFATNILKHLREGLMKWLFGSLAQGRIELPESFDPKGIVKLLASIFGLSWANIRARLVNAVGERAVGLMIKSSEIFSLLSEEGPAGVWHLIVKEVGDVKDMIVEKAKSFVVTEIIMAGIEWLISLLNPVSAFIKACKLIYQIVMFFVENASRIARFVDTILDSVGDIARGAVGGVAEKIESALAQMVPILIGFLARVLNISGIGKRIREIVSALQKPVNKALDGIIATGLKLAGPAIRAAKGIGTKVKAKVEAGKAWVKGKVEAGKQGAKGKLEAGKTWAKGKVTGKAAAAGTGPIAALGEADRMLAGKPNRAGAQARTAEIGKLHGTPLRLVVEKRASDGEHVHVQAMATGSHVLPAYDPSALTDATLWEHADRTVKLVGETKETRTDRAAAARAELARRIAGQANALLVGHMSTRGPRPTRGASGEDSAGNNRGHIAARHVLGQTRLTQPSDRPHPALGSTVTLDWLAYRAVTNTPGTRHGLASAFADPTAAATAIQSAVAALTADWTAFRRDLLVNGRVQQIVPVAAGGVCLLNNQRTPSPGLLPAWLGGPTNRKLHRGDTNATDDPPLADGPGAPSLTEVRILPDANAPNGWFVHSAWPTI